VVTNVYLPLDNVNGEERRTRASSIFAAEVTVLNGQIHEISQDDLRLVRWDRYGLIFDQGRSDSTSGPVQKVVFRKNGSIWEKNKTETASISTPEIVLEEDMSNAPKIYAVDTSTHRALLLDLNPQFRNLEFPKVEEIRWTASDGHQVTGGLYYPIHFREGHRYPLVIQTHGWEHDRFRIDGPYTTGYAAQPLAGKDIFVLQIEDDTRGVHGTPQEGPHELASFQGAIDYLDKKGTIDLTRIGLMGFSRTCFAVKYALTASAFHFAAASVTDGFEAGYFQYLLSANSSVQGNAEREGLNEGMPWGDGLNLWMTHSTGFHLDAVNAPIRITAENQWVLLYEWEWFSGLSRLGKPVEMIYMQDGEHILQRPWERMISQQGNVDWFLFWLTGEEDPNPAKADQYFRWRALRKRQEGLASTKR